MSRYRLDGEPPPGPGVPRRHVAAGGSSDPIPLSRVQLRGQEFVRRAREWEAKHQAFLARYLPDLLPEAPPPSVQQQQQG